MLCRVCAVDQSHTIPIFSSSGLEIAPKLKKLLTLEVSEDDQLPTVICLTCFNKVNNFHEFISNAVQAQRVLGLIFGVIPTDSTVLALHEAIPSSSQCNSDKTISPSQPSPDSIISELIVNDVETFVDDVSIEEKNELVVDFNSGPDENETSTATFKVDEECIEGGGQHQDDDSFDEEDEDQNKTLNLADTTERRGKSNKSRQHRPEFRNLLCTKCDEKFGGAKELTNHYSFEHHMKTVFKCVYCSQYFDKYRSFTRHVINHKETPRFTCGICNKSFLQKIGLKNHSFTHTDIRTFDCTECTLKFKHLSALYQHKKNIHSGKQFICEYCDESFQSAINLEQHKKAKHLNQKDKVCNICGKGYASTPALRYHLLTHVKGNHLKHECKTCSRKFASILALKRHTEKQHEPEAYNEDNATSMILKTNVQQDGTIIYVCDICGIDCPDKDTFIKHFEEHKKMDETIAEEADAVNIEKVKKSKAKTRNKSTRSTRK